MAWIHWKFCSIQEKLYFTSLALNTIFLPCLPIQSFDKTIWLAKRQSSEDLFFQSFSSANSKLETAFVNEWKISFLKGKNSLTSPEFYLSLPMRFAPILVHTFYIFTSKPLLVRKPRTLDILSNTNSFWFQEVSGRHKEPIC